MPDPSAIAHAPEDAGKPVAELILKLTDTDLETAEGQHRGTAKARLVYEPDHQGSTRRYNLPRRFDDA